ncbi:unnamed protein product [Chondrus crispus]|uniref:Uncharacterized protein n=1 Tax=Chondrus crispus TaxID=2769 RepID=R7QDX8_CHOCR|nr:unnamed protein product [Chondrus crispus]CDF35958.1 unnamed protein product [Chondrus crispus]|eukprot:XP_005715777.1 unnamed protein product [Chondrus crispus]
MAFDHLAENTIIVLLAYTAAFLPWTALTTFDFISAKWRRVRDVRIAGYVNLVLALVPAFYILFYMVVQSNVDQKEMFTALVAMLFALLHVVRTLWGLWQLQLFVKWAVKSITSLRALGIEYELNTGARTGHDGKKQTQNGQEREQETTNIGTTQEPGNTDDKEKVHYVAEIVDELWVSDELIENRVFHGNARCYIVFDKIEFRIDPKRRNVFRQRIVLLLQALSIPFRYVYGIVQKWLGNGSIPCFVQVPHKPEDVWLRWCVAFAAQGLNKWITEFTAAPEVDDEDGAINNLERYERRREHLAGRVLATAGIQLWLGSCLPLDEGKSLLSKEDLLRRAMTSGRGMPFDAVQRNAVLRPGKG